MPPKPGTGRRRFRARWNQTAPSVFPQSFEGIFYHSSMSATGGAWAAAAIVLCLLGPAGDARPAAETDPYRVALPGYRYACPGDYFEHPDFGTEWWYYTGNLRDDGGKRFGFELVFFRRGQPRDPAENRSGWR